MKKITFIFAAIFAATFANAQITLEHTFDGYVQPLTYSFPSFASTYFVQQKTASQQISIYNTDYTYYKTANISIPEGYTLNTIVLSLYNIFCPNKLGLLVSALKSGNYNTQLWYGIFDEDGVLLKDLGYAYSNNIMMCDINGEYYLFVTKMSINTENYTTNYDKTDVYSLPGNGNQQSLNSPYSQKPSARKIFHDGQIFIQAASNTYDLTGAEINVP